VVVAIIAIVAAGLSIFLGIKAKNNENNAKDILAMFLESDANKLYNEENFKDAKSGYERLVNEDLLKYTDMPDSIKKQIGLCIRYDTTKPLFYLRYYLSDSLTNNTTIDNLINADSLIGMLKSLDYFPAKSKLDALITRHTDKKQKMLDQLNELLDMQMGDPDKEMYTQAEETLFIILKLNPTDQQANDLLKSVKHYNDSLRHIK